VQHLHGYLLAGSPCRYHGVEAMVLFCFCGDFLLDEAGYRLLQQYTEISRRGFYKELTLFQRLRVVYGQ